MSDGYKLVYRGEVLTGQHPAVVRKRLAESMAYGSDHLDLLFSGRPVVVKRGADAATAARLQALFKQAGARLLIVPAESASVAAGTEAAMPRQNVAAAEPARELQLLPSGSAVLRDDERQPWQPREIDTGGLSLAAVGARLAPPPVATVPTVDPDALKFDVAPAGARLADATARPPAAMPDTSHLSIANPD